MQYYAIPCNTMQYHAIQCNTMQYNAIQCNTMQYHASLITDDGAYDCPVGSIMAIFSIIILILLLLSCAKVGSLTRGQCQMLYFLWDIASSEQTAGLLQTGKSKCHLEICTFCQNTNSKIDNFLPEFCKEIIRKVHFILISVVLNFTEVKQWCLPGQSIKS